MKMLRTMKAYLIFTLIIGVFILPGCGGDDKNQAGGGKWDKPLRSLAVTPAAATIPIAGFQQYTAIATYEDGTTNDVTTSSDWVSVDTDIATVSPTTGVATGVSSGPVDITATFNGKTATVTLTVSPAIITSLLVTPAPASIPVTGTQQFTATAIYSDGSTLNVTEAPTTVWTAVNVDPLILTDVATLSANGVAGAGLATGEVVGTADITATFDGMTNTVQLVVNDAVLVSVIVTPTSATIPVDGTHQFTALATYSYGPPIDVTENAGTVWTTANNPLVGPDVASLSANGVLGAGLATGMVAGTADITATFGTMSDTVELIVNDAVLVSIMVTPATSTIQVDGTQQYIALATYSFGPPIDVTEDPATIWTIANVPLGDPDFAALSPNGVAGAGLATGVAEGIADITATFGLMSDTATLTVTALVVETIIPGAVCILNTDPTTIPTATMSDPTSDNQFASTSTIGVVPDGKLITATFSLEMDPLTIESAIPGALTTFTIKETVSGNDVPGTVAMDATNKIATFTTSAALLEDTRYTVSITTDAQSSTGIAIACPYEWDFKTIIPAEAGLPAVNLGLAASYGIASTAGVDNVGATTVNGDIVLHPLAECNDVTVGATGTIGACGGFAPVVNGTVTSPLYPDAGVTSLAVLNDLRAAYIALSPANMSLGVVNLPDATTMGAGAGSAMVELDNLFFPGLYQSLSSILITGDITLDASGNPDAVFVFQSSSSIGTAATGALAPHTRILLVNGAKASNVFWWVGSNQATLGTYTEFQGNILSYSSITMETGATSCGRLFAGASTDGAFVFGENIVSVPGSPFAPADCK